MNAFIPSQIERHAGMFPDDVTTSNDKEERDAADDTAPRCSQMLPDVANSPRTPYSIPVQWPLAPGPRHLNSRPLNARGASTPGLQVAP